jgi:predicted amidohydrolase
MKFLSSLALASLFLFCLSLFAQTPESSVVIMHVTVINPGTSSVEPDRAVTIIGNEIASVSDAAHFRPSAQARVIDGMHQFLIPGLWDMHVHSAFGDWFPGGRDIILPLFVANGVTGVRDMGGATTLPVES